MWGRVAGAGQPLDPGAPGQGLGVGGGQDAVLLAPDDQDRDAQAVQLAGQDRRLAPRRVHGGRHRAQRLLDAAVGAVAAEDHDRRHLPLGLGQHGVGRGARVLAQRHLQHLQLGRRWVARCPVRPLRWRWRLWERPEPAGIMTTRSTPAAPSPAMSRCTMNRGQ
jgi:hypothetical protein